MCGIIKSKSNAQLSKKNKNNQSASINENGVMLAIDDGRRNAVTKAHNQ